jgi:hypothetical protein
MVQIGCPETSVIPCRRFGTTHRSHLKGSRSLRLKMVQIGCTETSVIPYRRFGTTHRSHFQGPSHCTLKNVTDRLYRNVCNSLPTIRYNPSVPPSRDKVIVLLKMVQIGCTETSVIPFRRSGTTHRSHLQGSRSLYS